MSEGREGRGSGERGAEGTARGAGGRCEAQASGRRRPGAEEEERRRGSRGRGAEGGRAAAALLWDPDAPGTRPVLTSGATRRVDEGAAGRGAWGGLES